MELRKIFSTIWLWPVIFWLIPCSLISAEEVISLRTGKLFSGETDGKIRAGQIALEIERTLIEGPAEKKERLHWDKTLSGNPKRVAFGNGLAGAEYPERIQPEVTGTHWTGWRVRQNLQERSVIITEDGSMVTDIRERWTCLRRNQRTTPYARLVYRPIPELTVFESIKVFCNETEISDTLKSGTKRPYARIIDWPDRGKTILLANLHSGVVIEVRLKLRQRPLIAGHFFSTIVLTGPYPVERSIYQITIPGKSPIFYQQTPDIPPPQITTHKTNRVYRWDMGTLADCDEALGGRKTEMGPPRVVVSSTDRWDVIQSWFADHFRTPESSIPPGTSGSPLTVQPEFKDTATIISFIRSVAEQIQPSANRNRLGGLVPSCPFEVWEKKKGDCKDVVALLCFLLQGAMVRVRPVLVSPLNLKGELPNPHIFTHAILKLETPDGKIFIDPQTGNLSKETDWKDHILEL